MGAKTWVLVHTAGDARKMLNRQRAFSREATIALVNRLFSPERLAVLDDGDLSQTCPPDGEVIAACYPGVTVVAAVEFGLDTPSKLDRKFVDAFSQGTLYLLAMHSVTDWFAYAVWEDGKLQRSLSLSPDSGILEDLGSRRPFEEPFWAGAHPAFDPEDGDMDYPFAFDPLDLGNAALYDILGYQMEGELDPNQLDPSTIPLMRFKRKQPWWRFGRSATGS